MMATRTPVRAVPPEIARSSQRASLVRKSARRLGVILLLWPVVLGLVGINVLDEYWLSVGIAGSVLAIAAMGMTLMLRYGGLLSLAQGTYVGVGMYAAAKTPLTGWPGLFVALGLGILVVAVAGVLVIRLRHFYFALGTLAISLVVEAVVRGYPAELGGPNGLPVFITIPGISTSAEYFLATCAVLQGVVLMMASLRHSRWGRAASVVTEDETLGESVGISVQRVRMTSYLAGSSFAVTAGVLAGGYQLFVAPSSLSYFYDFEVLVASLLGGVSATGAAAGAAVVTLLPEATENQSAWEGFVLGVVIVLLVLVKPLALRYLRVPRRRLPAVGGTGDWTDEPVDPSRGTVHWPVMEAGEMVLRADALLVAFGGVRAVDGVSLEVVAGRLTALIGPNGAGKTTLFNLLSGAMTPHDGAVHLHGRNVTRHSARRMARAGVARTFQLPRAAESMTVLQAVQVGTHLSGRAGFLRGATGLDLSERARSTKQARAALGGVGLLQLAHRPVAELGTGHRKLLEVARCLSQHPTVLLLDEPAGGLDHDEAHELGKVIRSLADGGLPVLFIEHSMDLVMGIADEVAVMEEGRLIARGAPTDVRNDEEVVRAYLR